MKSINKYLVNRHLTKDDDLGTLPCIWNGTPIQKSNISDVNKFKALDCVTISWDDGSKHCHAIIAGEPGDTIVPMNTACRAAVKISAKKVVRVNGLFGLFNNCTVEPVDTETYNILLDIYKYYLAHDKFSDKNDDTEIGVVDYNYKFIPK